MWASFNRRLICPQSPRAFLIIILPGWQQTGIVFYVLIESFNICLIKYLMLTRSSHWTLNGRSRLGNHHLIRRADVPVWVSMWPEFVLCFSTGCLCLCLFINLHISNPFGKCIVCWACLCIPSKAAVQTIVWTLASPSGSQQVRDWC